MEHNQPYIPYLQQQSPWLDHSGYHSHHASPVHEYQGFAFGSHPIAPETMYAHAPHHISRAAHQQLQPLVMPQWPSMLASQGPSPAGYHTHSAAASQASPSQSGTPLTGPPQILPAPGSAPPQLASSPPVPQSSNARKTLSDADRRRMCIYAEENPTKKQTEIGEMFGVERSTVSKVLRQKEKYLQPEEGSKSPIKRAKGKFPDIERALTIWAKNQESKGYQLTDDMIRRQAKFFTATVQGGAEAAAKMNSASWLEKFKQKNGLMGFKSRKGSMTPSETLAYFDSIGTDLTSANLSPTVLSRTASPTAFGQDAAAAEERPYFRQPFHSQSNTSLASAFAEGTPSTFSPEHTGTNSPLFTPDTADSNSYFAMAPLYATPGEASMSPASKPRGRSQTFPFASAEPYISPAPSSQSNTPELTARVTTASSGESRGTIKLEKSPIYTDMPPPRLSQTQPQTPASGYSHIAVQALQPSVHGSKTGATTPSSSSAPGTGTASANTTMYSSGTTSASLLSPTASPQSSSAPPTHEDARKALELFLVYCDNHPAAAQVVEAQEYVAIGQLMAKLKVQQQHQLQQQQHELQQHQQHQLQQQQQQQQQPQQSSLGAGQSPAIGSAAGFGDSSASYGAADATAPATCSGGRAESLAALSADASALPGGLHRIPEHEFGAVARRASSSALSAHSGANGGGGGDITQ